MVKIGKFEPMKDVKLTSTNTLIRVFSSNGRCIFSAESIEEFKAWAYAKKRKPELQVRWWNYDTLKYVDFELKDYYERMIMAVVAVQNSEL